MDDTFSALLKRKQKHTSEKLEVVSEFKVVILDCKYFFLRILALISDFRFFQKSLRLSQSTEICNLD